MIKHILHTSININIINYQTRVLLLCAWLYTYLHTFRTVKIRKTKMLLII